MHVYNHGSRPFLQRCQFLFGYLERAVQRRHICPPHQLENSKVPPAGRFDHHTSMTRHTIRIVSRPKQAWFSRKVVEDFPLAPRMISCGNNRETETEQFFCQLRRDAKPAGRVLTVPDHDVDLPLSHQSGYSPGQCSPPRFSKYIADKKHPHLAYSTYRLSRITVTLIVPG